MKTDRELLELAAKAAGLDYRFNDSTSAQPHWVRSLTGYTAWNPLTDGDDALRLAVKLEIRYSVSNGATWVEWSTGKTSSFLHHEPHGGDPSAATRRAIVRAAAEIGNNT